MLPKRLQPTVPSYRYSYPLAVFSTNNVDRLGKVHSIRDALDGRNPYYKFLNAGQRNLLVDRANSLRNILGYVFDLTKALVPFAKIISVYSYGGYLYGPQDFVPGDIDLGIVIKGSIFRYALAQNIPPFLLPKLNAGVRKADLFIYGEDNMVNGTPVDDSVVGGIMHRNSTQHEVSVAYWRNVVVYGRDFISIENNLCNAYASMLQMLRNTYERLSRYGNYKKEDDKTCLCRIASRLYEVNVFLTLFGSKPAVDRKRLLELPGRGIRNELFYNEALNIYTATLSTYNKIGREFLK